MNEKILNSENASEKILNEREVFNVLDEIIDGDFEILRNLSDEHGLYILEVQTIDEAGDVVMYIYTRTGRHPEGESTSTRIDVAYFSDGIPVGGEMLKKFEEGAWINETS